MLLLIVLLVLVGRLRSAGIDRRFGLSDFDLFPNGYQRTIRTPSTSSSTHACCET